MSRVWRQPTDSEIAEILEHAYRLGLDEDHYDTDERRVDWHAVYDDCEALFADVDLGTDLTHPTLRAIQAAYRRGRKSVAS